ncbi:glycosyltransferase [Polaromonas sp. JS666]|uniref:glycosyltransferase n=1 Tax=Polaromonas sp. (strain JS666 / ATCC BAA-500) TaxID=296591 RepID=UPI0000464CBF|nr:glycosyltransferase [Polaromonas sp. JS666]ABE45910.1 glycosyl transferase, group 1 [Polaromonas sp. JS666]
MRVLQFGRFWHDQHGGIERHVALLSKELATLGVEVVNLVAAQNLQGSDVTVDGYRLVQVPSLGMVFSTALAPGLVFKALALHREKKFDVLHLHLPDPLSHLASLALPSSIKRVITWHSDIIRQKKLLALYEPFLRHITRQADALVAATQAHFDASTQIPHDIPAQRRHVIPYGLDYAPLVLNPRTAVLRDELRARAQGKGLVFALGRHVYYKGFDVLIEALQHTDAFLVLGGDGPLRPQLEQQAAALGVSNRVHFSGRIPEEDLAAYFNACDVFCLPSVEPSEAFGLVQLEAMACGKPVVCTQLNNGVNVVNVDGQTGFAVPVRDPLALGHCLARLLKDDALREKLGQQALAHTDNYSVPTMAASHFRLYQDLLSTSR